MNFDKAKTKAMRAFLAKEARSASNPEGRVIGLSIEDDGVFIYTKTSEWDNGDGSGTFREDSETKAIAKFKSRVTRNDAGRH